MVTYYFRANKKVRLTPDKREAIATTIVQNFKSFYNDLTIPKQETQAILKELYPAMNESTGKLNKIPSLYEQYKTYTSAIQRACYSSYDAILDIEGQDQRSNNLASTYKASIVYDWYNINLMKTLDECQEDWAKKGEAACVVCWKEDITEIKVGVPTIITDEYGMPKLIREQVAQPIQTFAAVDVKRIDPHNLYFDKAQVDNWQSCRKIYRDFVALENILANTSYELTKREKDALSEMVYGNKKEVDNLHKAKIDEYTRVISNCVEVLEFEGDFIDPDTHEVFRNMEATVVAGKYLARFQESNKPKSSIIWACYMPRPDTGRGQSPLRIPQILNAVQNACADLTMQAWKLSVYPTFLAPKGAFTNYVEVRPGVPVEYDSSVLMGQPPQRLDFSQGMRGFDFSDFFQRKMENATGINQYMQGQNDGVVRTASESSFIHAGATMRMNREAHLFSHNFLYPLVRLYALYKKVFDTNDSDIKLANGEFAKVNDEVRNGNYTFIIGGSQSAIEREAETNKLFQVLGLPAFQSLIGLVDPYTASEFLKWILNRSNFKATNQIMEMLNMNGQIRQIAQQLGIQENNFEGFRRDMQTAVELQLPQIADTLINLQNNT